MLRAAIFDMYETLVTLYASARYFSEDIAADIGVPLDDFRRTWHSEEANRTLGKIALEQVLEQIMRENGKFSPETLAFVTEKRRQRQSEVFNHIHEGIIPMLKALRARGVLVGLISNCFSEEAELIKGSVLFPYFDAVCLSYDEGVMKPDPEIYRRCTAKLGVDAAECLYIGDGGSRELETAEALGMATGQALWYLKRNTRQPADRKPEFRGINDPMDVLNCF